jgi:adenylate cyclase
VSGVSPAMPALRGMRVRSVAATILVVLAVFIGSDLPRVLPLQGAWFDALERRAPRPVATTPVTIVEIDDKSLAALGRWPWPRSLVAELVQRIAAFSPGVIGVDIVMPEPDPLSPERALAHVEADAALRERIAALPSNDAQLAAALHSAPTVLAMVGAPERTMQALRAAPVLAGGAHEDAALVARAPAGLASYPGALSSVGVLTNAAHGWGLISAEDTRGVVRQIPLVANVNGTLVPGLAVEMWRVALGARALRLSIEHGAVSAVRIGNDTFRTQADGSARPWFSVHRPERFVSAVDVLNGTVDGDRLRRSFVLIGVTGLALGDYVWTPVEKMPGVEVHAQTLESMNERAFLVRPRIAPVVESAALLIAGGLLIVWMPGWPVRHGAIAAVACAVAFGALSYAVFREQRLLFDAATPAVALALLFATLLALQLADSTRHRKALQRVLQQEREEAARVAGELQAARRVQLDSLPRTDAVRDSRVELAAVMEPALEVGGDLYDFYLLDDDRLFFMLGDVSGKGLAASIFMAVSKALCKSTMLRASDADLGVLLTHANAEVGRDNPGALFVTVFAGVLDLRTGMLDYCNAGQEDPWRRDARGSVSRLAGGGGPPLCVVDDFAYRSMRVALQPGELVCVVSDGVTEANDPSEAMYGAPRVGDALAGVTSASLAVAAIRDDVSRFAKGAAPSDDRTVLALRWRGA